ncbi:MAG TPA: hypothetical protein VFY65_04110 [Longimicrobium sp.]|nr:hypothetical protein [Longimicrobium sp.]
MKKLTLALEGLEVQTFNVTPDGEAGGGRTVAGYEETENSCQQTCPDYTCMSCPVNTVCPCDPAYYSENSCSPGCDPYWTHPAVSPSCAFTCYATCGC